MTVSSIVFVDHPSPRCALSARGGQRPPHGDRGEMPSVRRRAVDVARRREVRGRRSARPPRTCSAVGSAPTSAASAARARCGTSATPINAMRLSAIRPSAPSESIAATPTSAKSPCRRATSLERVPGRRIGGRDPHLDDALVVVERGGEVALEEVGGGDRALARRAASDDRAVERGDHARDLGRGVGVRNGAADRAPRADGRVADERQRLREQRQSVAHDRRPLGRALAHRRRRTRSRRRPTRSPTSPATRLMSTTCVGRARRMASSGTRLCPPARTLASSPCSARRLNTSSTVSGAWYSNRGNFNRVPPSVAVGVPTHETGALYDVNASRLVTSRRRRHAAPPGSAARRRWR